VPDTDSITLIKSFTYRGAPEEFSNTYHLDGTTPTDHDGWKTVADDLIALEQPLFNSSVHFVRAYGYEAGHNHADAVIDYETTDGPVLDGTVFFDGAAAPGDAAMYCGWWDGQYDTRGKKIYLRKYFHGVFLSHAGGDLLFPLQLTHLQTFAEALLTDPISGDLRLVSPQGHAPVNSRASQYVTTRTLKRRGKRPPG
jgi:hypothetical protein